MRNGITVLMLLSGLLSGIAAAQTPQAPPAPVPVYTGSFGGGFALTSGNSDTRNFNLSFGLVRDPKTRDVLRVDAFYLRGSQNDILSLNRSSIKVRDEHTLSDRMFAFGQMEYLRDEFKDIRYLLAPGGGLGYHVVRNDSVLFSVSGGAGGVWEKNSGIPVNASGSLNAAETLSWKMSPTSAFTHSIATLWKTSDFADSLTNFAVGVTTSINSRLELKVEFLDAYKNRPPNVTVKKNDTAFVTAFVLKF